MYRVFREQPAIFYHAANYTTKNKRVIYIWRTNFYFIEFNLLIFLSVNSWMNHLNMSKIFRPNFIGCFLLSISNHLNQRKLIQFCFRQKNAFFNPFSIAFRTIRRRTKNRSANRPKVIHSFYDGNLSWIVWHFRILWTSRDFRKWPFPRSGHSFRPAIKCWTSGDSCIQIC